MATNAVFAAGLRTNRNEFIDSVHKESLFCIVLYMFMCLFVCICAYVYTMYCCMVEYDVMDNMHTVLGSRDLVIVSFLHLVTVVLWFVIISIGTQFP